MRVNLPEKWTRYLISKPESGMGYQRVDVEFDDGTHLEGCIVVNAEQLELPEQFASRQIERLTLSD